MFYGLPDTPEPSDAGNDTSFTASAPRAQEAVIPSSAAPRRSLRVIAQKKKEREDEEKEKERSKNTPQHATEAGQTTSRRARVAATAGASDRPTKKSRTTAPATKKRKER